MSRLRLRFVPPARLSRSHKIGVVIGTLIAVVGVLGLVFNLGSSSTTRAVDESPADFLAQLVKAERAGDAGFLLARLDPAVIARYGEPQCRTAATQFHDPSAALRLLSVSGPGRYAYESDGHSVNVGNTYTLHVTGTEDNQPVTRDLHFALVDHLFRIFIECGQPLPGAP